MITRVSIGRIRVRVMQPWQTVEGAVLLASIS
jgi:hypothetical protein